MVEKRTKKNKIKLLCLSALMISVVLVFTAISPTWLSWQNPFMQVFGSGLGKSEVKMFSDDGEILSNPDRGAVVTEENALREVFSVIDLEDEQYQVNFYRNPHLHKEGGIVEWYDPNGDYTSPKGRGTVSGWSGNKDIHIGNIAGNLPQRGDYFKNYFGDNSLYFFRMKWSEVEPVKGSYDFTHVTENPNYKFAKAQGMQLVYRLNMNTPHNIQPKEIHIPRWLYDELVDSPQEHGTWYEIEYHGGTDFSWGFSPNYANKLLIDYHEPLIQAIAEKFKDNTLHIQMGSLGHWGELHGYMPNEEVQRQYYQHYIDAFGPDKVSMRRNMNFMRENSIPVYFDMLGHPLHLGGQWNEHWGLLTEMEGYTDMNGIHHEPYLNFRASGPIGGEHSPMADGQVKLYDYSNQSSGRRYERTLAMAEDLEMSYVYMITPSFGLQNVNYLEFQDNVDDFMRKLGYRFYIPEFSYEKKTTDLDISVTFKNAGIARSYRDYPVNIAFYNNSNELIAKYDLNIPLTEVLRGNQQTYHRTISDYPDYTRFGIEIEGVVMPMKAHEIKPGVYEMGHINDPLK